MADEFNNFFDALEGAIDTMNDSSSPDITIIPVPAIPTTDTTNSDAIPSKVIKIVPELGFGIEDMPVDNGTDDFNRFTDSQIKSLIQTLPSDEEGFLSVFIIDAHIRLLVPIDLMMIKALHDIFPFLSEFRVTTSGFTITCRQPLAVIINDYKQQYKIKEVFCSIGFTFNAGKHTAVITSGPNWMRPLRTTNEHNVNFTLSHVNNTSPGQWQNGCLGSTDLYYTVVDFKDNIFNYDLACIMLVSIKGYTSSEFIDGVPDTSIGELHKVRRVSCPSAIVLKCQWEYLKTYSQVEGMNIVIQGNDIRVNINAENPAFIDQILALPSCFKVVKNHSEYGLPTKSGVDIEGTNKANISCGNFRGKRLTYKVYDEEDEDPIEHMWYPHPDITNGIANTITSIIASNLFDSSYISPKATISNSYTDNLVDLFNSNKLTLKDILITINTKLKDGSSNKE